MQTRFTRAELAQLDALVQREISKGGAGKVSRADVVRWLVASASELASIQPNSGYLPPAKGGQR